MDSVFGNILEWADDAERHEIIKDMRGDSDSAQRQKMLSMRVEVFCAEWAQFVCEFEKAKTDAHAELPTDLYHRYWLSTGTRRLVLMAIMNCYYNGWKVKPTQIARGMRIAKSAVTLILKEAKELGLTIVGGKKNSAHYPSLHTVKGFVSTLRNEGFDVFDDIINHNYDAEVDPWVRMELLLEELQRLCKTDTVSLRKQVWSRLESNAALVEQIHTNARKTHKVQTNRLVDEIQQLYKSTPST